MAPVARAGWNAAAPGRLVEAARRVGTVFRLDRSWSALVVPAVVFLIVFYLVPLAFMAVRSVTTPAPGFGNFARLVQVPGYLRIGIQTLWIAAAVTVICLVIGYPVAYAITTAAPAARQILLIAVISPYLTSVLVRTFAWEVLLGRLGIVNRVAQALHLGSLDLLLSPAAVVIGLVHLSLPLMILPLVSVMQHVDPNLPRSAASLGAGPLEALARVFIPLTAAGIQTGCVLVFVYSIGAFITPAILGGQSGQMLGVIVQFAVEHFADFGFAAAVAVLLTLAVIIVLAAYQRVFAANIDWLAGGAGARGDLSRRRRRSAPVASRGGPPWSRPLYVAARCFDRSPIARTRMPLTLYTVAVAGFLLLPQLVAIPVSLSATRSLIFPPPGLSLRWYANFVGPDWLRPAVTSIEVGTAAAVLATTLGALAAVATVRALPLRLGGPVTYLILMPLLVPAVVSGVALYLAFVNIGLTDSVLGLIVAHTALTLPFAFSVVAATVRSLNPNYESAALSLGAGRLTVLRRIVLPLVHSGVVVALLFTFLISFDEAVVAIFLSGIHVKTLPRRMFEALTLESDPTIGVVATLSLAVALLVLVAWALVSRRGSGAPVKVGLFGQSAE